ncbi:uncharacterized protein LOC131027383 [Cryptomeria japonica]|uniref:uncharacterized protein LOC131027383 n=1 Tax=Cryptomeria japonica TaxID=3369 RepID=UPI0025ABB676|nr:uncharacterized protein LOC131027383 [Cryptomeria japonica]
MGENNFDGASKGNPRTSDTRCVACDDEGNILFIGARRLQDGIDNEVEARVALLEADLVVNMKAMKVHLEGDSQIVVNASIKGDTPCWKLNNFIHIIREKLKFVQYFCISHVKRGGNVIADGLSNVACELSIGEVRWCDCKDGIVRWS